MMGHEVKSKSDAARTFAANSAMAAKKPGTTVPAAWPSGLAQFTQTYMACHRCEAEDACADFLVGAADSIPVPPKFCPNGAEFARLNKAKQRA